MSQITTKDKILKCADKLNLSLESTRFLNTLVEDCNNTIIDGYSFSKNHYIHNYFDGDPLAYINSLKELSEKYFIKYNTDQDKMIILVLQPHHLNNLLYGFKSIRKKKHKRKPIDQQQGLFGMLTSGKLGELIDTALKKASHIIPEVNFKYKDKGFKVYESIMPYFTGQQLKEKERELLNKYNPEMVVLEDNRRNMPKNSMLAYCACLTFMDEKGIISDCTEYSLLQNVIETFGKDTFCVQTWYNSIERLVELKLIEKFIDDKDCPCMRVVGVDFNQRYVVIPFVVFEKDFKRVETAGLKMFFDILFGLNNGESINKDGTISLLGQDKAYFFKMAKLDAEKEENRDKFEKKLLQYKKRYPNEIRTAMFGDIAKWSRGEPKETNSLQADEEIKESDFKALSKYFNFQYVSGTALMIRIRKDYYISKKSDSTKKQLAIQVRHKRKMHLIDGLLKEHKIDYQDKDMVDLINVFKRENKRTVSLVINIIADRVRRSADLGWNKILSLGAYARKILKEYKHETIEIDKFDYSFEG